MRLTDAYQVGEVDRGFYHSMLPTLLDALQVSNDGSAMDGRSFWPVLRGETDSHREVMITGYHDAEDRCIRDTTWSYTLRPEGEGDELYNLVEDPRERRKVIDEYPQEARRLAGAFGKIYRRRAVAAGSGIQGRYELASSGLA